MTLEHYIPRGRVTPGSFERLAHTDVLIPTARILAMNTSGTAVEIVPAPGAGLSTLVEYVQINLTAGSAPIGGVGSGEDMAVSYTGSNIAIVSIETTNFLTSTADVSRIWATDTAGIGAVAGANLTTVENDAVNISSGGTYTGGTGTTLLVRTFYRTLVL